MSDDRVEGYRNFMNKLFQAGRFVRMHVDGETPRELPPALPVVDRWILSRLQRVVDEVRRGVEEYRSTRRVPPSTSSCGTSSATGIWR
jgi:valyl-tRNA synthetase